MTTRNSVSIVGSFFCSPIMFRVISRAAYGRSDEGSYLALASWDCFQTRCRTGREATWRLHRSRRQDFPHPLYNYPSSNSFHSFINPKDITGKVLKEFKEFEELERESFNEGQLSKK
jgi:hypothetical protein